MNLKTNIEKSNHFEILSHKSLLEGKIFVNSLPQIKFAKSFDEQLDLVYA